MSEKIRMIIAALILVAGAAHAIKFTGEGADNLFSTAGNWDTIPAAGDSVTQIDGGSSFDSRIQVDGLWSTALGAVYIKQVFPSAGWAYVEVLDGAALEAVSVVFGQNGTSRKGDLIVRSGSSLIAGNGGNSGSLSIGNASGGDGILTVEAGASFSGARLDLQETGTLVFEFGADSVSTFTSTRTTAGNANVLDGVLQLDLSALDVAGVYTLIDGSSDNLLIDGALKTWLDGNGGTVSGTGNLDTDLLDVVNASGVEWSLAVADSGRDLVFSVSKFGPILERSAVAVQDTGLRGSADINRADLGKAAGILLIDSSTRGLLEFDLSDAEYEITNAVLRLTQTLDLTGGSWEMSIYPLVYTTNNYNWYEGTGTVSYTSNSNSPASAVNAACYLYSRDDVSSPVQWEGRDGTPANNIVQAAVWNSAIATLSGTNSSAGNQITFNLDVAELETMRTNGVGRISLGIWGTESLVGNYILATRDHDDADYHPVLDLQMKAPDQDPVATGLSVGAIAAGNRVEVAFDADAAATLWFSPSLTVPAWTNVASGLSPLLHTNDAPQGFYKVTASE